MVHDCDLNILRSISHSDGRVDRIVVVTNLHLRIKSVVWSEVSDALLHLKAIRVRVEDILVIDAIKAPLCDNFATFAIIDRYLKHLNLELDRFKAFTEAYQSLVDSLALAISVNDSELAS